LSDAIYGTALEKHLTKPIGSLSKGFRQRVGLAQAILHQPEVLILDEPTNGLDPTQILEIRELIRRLAENATVIISTHILSEVEATCHRAIIVMEGQVRSDARLDELKSTSGAVVAVPSSATDVEPALAGISGVRSVDADGRLDGYQRYRVVADRGVDLCPLIFDLAKDRDWRLAELRPDTRTLESVFRELAEKGAAAA
jgi:ABC-2 type transport system ATP-binding protein